MCFYGTLWLHKGMVTERHSLSAVLLVASDWFVGMKQLKRGGDLGRYGFQFVDVNF